MPACHCPFTWESMYAFTESVRSILKGGCCGNTSGADLEMAVCNLSWPYSVRVSHASQASQGLCLCLFESCLRFTPLYSYKLLLLSEHTASPS